MKSERKKSRLPAPLLISLLAAGMTIALPQVSAGATIVTSDPTEASAFVGAITPIGFDDVTSNIVDPGTVIPTSAQISNNYQNLGVLISSTGGPAFASNRAIDATSDPNLLGGTSLNGSGQLIIDYVQPITLNFVVPSTSTPGITNLIGAWNDPSGSRIRLEVFDATNTLLGSIEADQGQFLGITAIGIASAKFSYVQTQSFPGITIDDLYFGTPAPVPVPATAWLLGSGMLALIGIARRHMSG